MKPPVRFGSVQFWFRFRRFWFRFRFCLFWFSKKQKNIEPWIFEPKLSPNDVQMIPESSSNDIQMMLK